MRQSRAVSPHRLTPSGRTPTDRAGTQWPHGFGWRILSSEVSRHLDEQRGIRNATTARSARLLRLAHGVDPDMPIDRRRARRKHQSNDSRTFRCAELRSTGPRELSMRHTCSKLHRVEPRYAEQDGVRRVRRPGTARLEHVPRCRNDHLTGRRSPSRPPSHTSNARHPNRGSDRNQSWRLLRVSAARTSSRAQDDVQRVEHPGGDRQDAVQIRRDSRSLEYRPIWRWSLASFVATIRMSLFATVYSA